MYVQTLRSIRYIDFAKSYWPLARSVAAAWTAEAIERQQQHAIKTIKYKEIMSAGNVAVEGAVDLDNGETELKMHFTEPIQLMTPHSCRWCSWELRSPCWCPVIEKLDWVCGRSHTNVVELVNKLCHYWTDHNLFLGRFPLSKLEQTTARKSKPPSSSSWSSSHDIIINTRSWIV